MATIQREVFEMTGALMDHHMQEQFCGISGDPIILGSRVARYDQVEYDATVREMSKILKNVPQMLLSCGELFVNFRSAVARLKI